jgi:hypothetical protein
LSRFSWASVRIRIGEYSSGLILPYRLKKE